MDEKNLRQVNNSLSIIRQLLPLVDDAEKQFKSSRNWGFADIFFDGWGGLLTGLLKHSQLNNAQGTMNQIQFLMNQLQLELNKIVVPVDYRMQLNGFVTFADFFMDCPIVDVYMQVKIMNSIKQVQELRQKLLELQDKLVEFSRL